MEDERNWATMLAGQQARLVEEAIAFGIALREVRDWLGHVRFLKMVAGEFSLSRRAAETYIGLAETFGDLPANVRCLPLHLIQKIAAPTAPAEFRAQLRNLLHQGECPSSSTLLAQFIYAREEADEAKRAEKRALKRRRSLAWRPRARRRQSIR